MYQKYQIWIKMYLSCEHLWQVIRYCLLGRRLVWERKMQGRSKEVKETRKGRVRYSNNDWCCLGLPVRRPWGWLLQLKEENEPNPLLWLWPKNQSTSTFRRTRVVVVRVIFPGQQGRTPKDRSSILVSPCWCPFQISWHGKFTTCYRTTIC